MNNSCWYLDKLSSHQKTDDVCCNVIRWTIAELFVKSHSLAPMRRVDDRSVRRAEKRSRRKQAWVLVEALQ